MTAQLPDMTAEYVAEAMASEARVFRRLIRRRPDTYLAASGALDGAVAELLHAGVEAEDIVADVAAMVGLRGFSIIRDDRETALYLAKQGEHDDAD